MFRLRPRILRGVVLAAGAGLAAPGGAANVPMVGGQHDFSVGGSSAFRSFGEDEVCIFCHAPHTAEPKTPLWNRSMPRLTYKLYSSSTLTAEPGQPSGSSKLCLSCHDGTIALGKVRSRPGAPIAAQVVTGRANLETDLSDDHPISFEYDSALAAANPELVDPGALAGSPLQLDRTGQMQCTTCHAAHASPYPDLLVMDNAYSALCVSCHDPEGWLGSAHQSSAAPWNRMGNDPWPHSEGSTVAENGCQSCHTPHAAGLPERLLVFEKEENNCLSCHNGNVAETDIARELGKRSTHPVWRYLREHDPTEDSATMPRHVECQDCHNPHAAMEAGSVAPYAGGALYGAAGVTSEGVPTESVSFEYEVCFRCHLDDPQTAVNRQVLQPSVRLRFGSANPSYHPVVAPGQNDRVPSLVPPWTVSSYVYCTDCHANDEGPGNQGSGPRGPHGSDWPFLLERQYTLTDGLTENYQRYELCYKCHSQASILNDESFPHHSQHVRDAQTSCATCHDPHGVREEGPGDHTHLINFNLNEVVANGDGQLLFEDRGSFAGSCSLNCHEREHRDESYQR